MWSKILKCPEASIYRIELPGPLPGYRQFITPWLITQTRGSKPLNILIDPTLDLQFHSFGRQTERVRNTQFGLGFSDPHTY